MNENIIKPKRKENKADASNNMSPPCIVRGDFDSLTDHEKMQIKNFDNDLLLKMLVEADSYFFADCIEVARKKLELYIRFQPHNAYVWNRLGTISSLQDDAALAIYYFTKAIEQGPDDLEYIFNLASSYVLVSRCDKAHELLRSSFVSHPEAKIKLYFYWFDYGHDMKIIKSAWRERKIPKLKVLNDSPIINGIPNQRGQP